MKRVVVKAFTAHSLTLAVDANKFLLEKLNERLPSLQADSVDQKLVNEEVQQFLNVLLGSADKSKCTQSRKTHFGLGQRIKTVKSSFLSSLRTSG